jgi:hypothetical protein
MNARTVAQSSRERPDGDWIAPLRLAAKLLGTVPAAIGWIFTPDASGSGSGSEIASPTRSKASRVLATPLSKRRISSQWARARGSAEGVSDRAPG